MRRHVLLLAVLAFGLLSPAAMATPPGSQVVSDPTIGSGCVGVGAAHTTEVAVQGRTIASTWTIGEDRGIGLALSHDGGRSWSRRAVPFTTCTVGPLEYALDPDLALGADGTPWLSASGNLPPADPVTVSTGDAEGQVLVAVGDAAPVSVFPGVTTERGFLETDPTNADRGWVLSRTLDRAFVSTPVRGVGIPPAPGPDGIVVLARTDDRGQTWRRSTVRVASPGTYLVALGLVRTGGSLVALSVELDLKDPFTTERAISSGFRIGRGPIAAQTSEDGGETWSPPVTLALVGQAGLLDAAAGDGLVAVAAPQVDGALLVWTSEDAGRTWRQTTAAIGIAHPATGIAVDRRGRVSVLSYAADGPVVTPQLSTSHDRGHTFGPPVALASPFDGDTVVSHSHVPPFGPYNGVDTDGRDVLVAFVADDDKNGSTESRLTRIRCSKNCGSG